MLWETISKVLESQGKWSALLSPCPQRQSFHHRKQPHWSDAVLGKSMSAAPSHLLVLHLLGNSFHEDIPHNCNRNWGEADPPIVTWILLLVLFLKEDSLQKVPLTAKPFEKILQMGLTVILTTPESHPVQFHCLVYFQFALAHSSFAPGSTSLYLTVLLGMEIWDWQ